MRFKFYSLMVAALISLVSATVTNACSVPVFRYALERWQPDTFQALVLHRGSLSDEQKKLIDAFERSEGKNRANVELVTVDLDAAPPPELLSLLEKQKETELPRILLMPPPFTGSSTPLWSGKLEDKTSLPGFNAQVDSPVRRETVKRLLAGDSAVWICLESGNKEADDKAFKLLDAQLAKLGKELKLPEQTPEDLEDPDSQVRFEKLPVRIAFSTIRVSRDNSQEKGLIDQLMKTEDDLLEESGKPMVFPVFGRGRALWAYIGAGINEENIAEAAQFLIGPCSCQIKRQNPGSDLLLTADWEGSLEGLIETKDVELPPLSGLEGFTVDVDDSGSSEGETAADVKLVARTPEVPIPTETASPPATVPSVEKTDLPDEVQIKEELVADGSKTLQRNIILLGVAGFALLAGITLLVRKKQ
ncbi:MAG: hypothetical protein VX272_10110 [Planctomycetota bacterium]|nr:hypothetical protein [Planctomycetota bacterium]